MRRVCGVLGSPIGHSLSPVLHRAGYRAVGLDWTYDAHEVSSGELPAFLTRLDDSWRGLSLTMPLKREALPLAAVVSDVARAAGAANTLVRRDDGTWAADNTDVPGLVAALQERWPSPVERAVILGGGATAASALLALATTGCREFTLAVRDPGRAADTLEVAERLADPVDVRIVGLGDDAAADLVVSTIPADAQTPELLAAYAAVPVVFDVVYDPWPTPLVAANGNRVVVTGLDLLVHQAALQFTMFTGLPAPLREMRDAGRTALA
ncbi:shikimate dehydrogenase [Nocardioides rotundus]|nr:shikimate dehydrogenase [Nocardioides rotundus]